MRYHYVDFSIISPDLWGSLEMKLAGVKLGGTGLDPTSGDKVEMLDD